MKEGILSIRWRVTVFLTLAGALNFADRSALSAVMVPLREKLQLSDAQLGLLGSFFLWSYAAASPFAGRLADLFSRSRLAVWSLGLWSLFTVLTGAAGGLFTLGLARVSLGLSESLYHPAAFALIGDHHGSATRGRAMSLLSGGFQFGIVIGGAAAGYMAEAWGWRAGFWVLGGIGVGLALLSRFNIVDAVPSRVKGAGKRGTGEAIHYLIRDRSYLAMLANVMLTGLPLWMLLGWLPLFLSESYHMRLGVAGFSGTFFLQAFLVLGLWLGGWFSDLVSRRSEARRLLAMAIWLLAAAPFYLIFLHHFPFPLMALAISLSALFRGLGTSNERPTVCDFVPTTFRATAFGFMNMFASIGGAFGVTFAGVLKSRFGLPAVFASCAGVYVLAGAVLLLAYRLWLPADIARAKAYEACGPAELPPLDLENAALLP